MSDACLRRNLAGLLPLLALVLSACVGETEAFTPAGTDAGAMTKVLHVGMVLDENGADDIFNRGATEGARRAVEASPGVTLSIRKAKDEAERQSVMRDMAAEGTQLVIGVGFLTSHAATVVAREHPRAHFAVIDYSLPSDASGRAMHPPTNLAGLNFREQEGSFVVGAIAGLRSRSGTVGFVGGMVSPLIRKFEAGYAAGVERTCPRCRVLVSYAGTTPAAFGDPATGRRLAMAHYDAGADIVYHASGATGGGVMAAARATGRLAIGVDSDQWGEAPGQVLTSMVKRMDVAVLDVITRERAGEFRGGVITYGLAKRGVDYVWDDRNRHMLSKEEHVRVETLRAAVAAGLIEVPVVR